MLRNLVIVFREKFKSFGKQKSNFIQVLKINLKALLASYKVAYKNIKLFSPFIKTKQLITKNREN